MTPERGAIAITLDRPRVLFFDSAATFRLVSKYGPRFAGALYELVGQELQMKNEEALIDFLYIGLQADAKLSGADFTLEMAKGAIRPWTVMKIFNATVLALTGAISTPGVELGKASARVAAAKPSAETPAAQKPQKVSTTSKRNGSRSRSSGGRRDSSGQ